MADPETFAIRSTRADGALLFLHGFSGEAHQTFGLLPAFVAGDPALAEWDLFCVGYPTSLAPDITGVWAADPDLTTLADYLRSVLIEGRFSDYRRIGFVAHSMGGLIVQRALVDADLDDRVSHVLQFGTPSAGLRKAGLGALFKRQARDMTAGGSFITSLRTAWEERFGAGTPFHFCAAAGLRDEFVPRTSSVDVFPVKNRVFVPGNHLEMVKPRRLDDDTVLLVRRLLLGDAHVRPFVSETREELKSRRAAIEDRDRSVVVAMLMSRGLGLEGITETELAALPPSAILRLSLMLEAKGRDEDAIAVLEGRYLGNAELTGVLAGRYKRRWLADPEGRSEEGPRARDLYAAAHSQAVAAANYAQAFYNAINQAFMTLALGAGANEQTPARITAISDARRLAERVLGYAQRAALTEQVPSLWRLATEGEALLHLEDVAAALARYRAARTAGPDPREAGSILQQAVWVARMLGLDEAEARLRVLFAELVLA